MAVIQFMVYYPISFKSHDYMTSSQVLFFWFIHLGLINIQSIWTIEVLNNGNWTCFSFISSFSNYAVAPLLCGKLWDLVAKKYKRFKRAWLRPQASSLTPLLILMHVCHHVIFLFFFFKSFKYLTFFCFTCLKRKCKTQETGVLEICIKKNKTHNIPSAQEKTCQKLQQSLRSAALYYSLRCKSNFHLLL